VHVRSHPLTCPTQSAECEVGKRMHEALLKTCMKAATRLCRSCLGEMFQSINKKAMPSGFVLSMSKQVKVLLYFRVTQKK
jgi:hypothetical protein